MISSKKELDVYLELDRRALLVDRKRPRIFGDEIWKFERALRHYEYYLNSRSNPLLLLFWRYRQHSLGLKLGFSIPPNVCGAGLSLAHIGPVVVNPKANIGCFCRIHTCVNIGAGGAKIGSCVYFGPGAKVVGNVSIADGVCVGANAVVVKDVLLKGATVAGVPAKQVSLNGSRGINWPPFELSNDEEGMLRDVSKAID